MSYLENVFTYHKPFGDQPKRYEKLRNMAKEFAKFIDENCPLSREQEIAFEKLREATMWANASIAINEKEK